MFVQMQMNKYSHCQSNIAPLNSILRIMSKIDKIKEKYVTDAEQMATKSRYGYFSIPPSHTAAVTDFLGTKPHRQTDGRVHTEPRNIYSGGTSTGSLKKNYFSYVPSAFHGSEYQDPGKPQRKWELEDSKRWKGKETYKPAKLNHTLSKAPYEYISDTDPKRAAKKYRNSDGKVITQSANVLISPQSKIEFNKIKVFKYTECPPEKKEDKNNVNKEEPKEEPFKTGSPKTDLFYSHSLTYFDADLKKHEGKKIEPKIVDHQAPFRPSCTSPGKPFTAVVYKEEGIQKNAPSGKAEKKENKQEQPFRLTKIEYSSKPCPSISCSKINLLRGCR